MSQNGHISKPTSTGDKSVHSQTLDHVTSYPVISDFLHFYTSNSFGAKSIHLVQSTYAHTVVPVLPYLSTPISIASPYLKQADKLGDSSLNTIDGYVPALKYEGFEQLRERAAGMAGWPLKVLGEGREYVGKVYKEENGKVGGEGLVKVGKSVLSTELRIVAEGLGELKNLVGRADQKRKDMGMVNGKAE